jgi:large subunit ribosomal protein L10
MPKTRAQKGESLQELTQLFKSGKSIMFADYQGMTVAKMTAMRKQLTGAKVDYVVSKKTLLAIAAKEAGYEVDFSKVSGMVGAAFAHEDEMAPAKLIGEAGKEAPIKLVGGIFDGKFIDAQYAISLSKLPSKSQLLGQLLNVFNGPAAAFVRVLNAHREKQEGGSTAA